LIPLIKFLAEYFKDNDWKWSLKGKGKQLPTESDFKNALDEAQKVLYDEKVGTILEVGRLVIIKQTKGFDVYVLAGTYNKGEK